MAETFIEYNSKKPRAIFENIRAQTLHFNAVAPGLISSAFAKEPLASARQIRRWELRHDRRLSQFEE